MLHYAFFITNFASFIFLILHFLKLQFFSEVKQLTMIVLSLLMLKFEVELLANHLHFKSVKLIGDYVRLLTFFNIIYI